MRQLLVLRHAVGERVAAERAGTGLVGLPDRGRGHAGQVAPHHQLHRERLALARDHHVRIGHAQHVIGRDVLGLLEPEPRELVQHLPLRRDGTDHGIERAQAIGDDDDPLAALLVDVAITDLAVVARQLATTDRGERRGIERVAELEAQRFIEVRDRHDVTPSARSRMNGA